MYIPKPIDTDSVNIPEELEQLMEQIAENVHEVWSKGRMAEGWTYGPVKNELTKETPYLVPYSELPEGEKEYDRNTAMATIKFIIHLGYSIIREGAQVEDCPESDDTPV